MRVAAIDVGTNSIHLLVAEISPTGEIQIVEKAREQVELGAGGFQQGRITPGAMKRGLQALVTFREAADSLGAEDIHAAATSAVREASNGSDFVRAVRERTGIHIHVISGAQEGRLIYLGVRADLDFSRGPALLMDLGGGSVEFVLCDADSALQTLSLPLGHIRLAERFHRHDPMSRPEVKALRAYAREALAPLLRRVGPSDFHTLVGTSGAVRTLGRMATLMRGEAPPEHGHGLVLHRSELSDLIRTFCSRKQSRLSQIPGMDGKRRRTLPSAAVLVHEVMERLQLKTLQTSERSLRDGLIVDWALKNAPEVQVSRTVPHPRMRTVVATMKRFGVDEVHARKVAELALQIFDGTASIHKLRPADRDMLEYAALLHDMGHHISGKDHNKHGAYLIRHIRMYSFTAPEIALLSNLIRYHRGSPPKRKHLPFQALSEPDQRRVRTLAGMLRVADALDRSHTQPVRELEISVSATSVQIVALTEADAHIERWAVQRRRDVLRDALRRPIEVHLRALPEVA